MSSKIHYYPVENFKSLLIFDETEDILTNFIRKINSEKINFSNTNNSSIQIPQSTNQQQIVAEKEKNLNRLSSFTSANVYEITFNLHRSIIELANLDSKRETRIRLADIESIKVYDDYLISLEMLDKISLYFIPKKQSEVKIIVEKISEYCKVFLGFEVNLEFFPISEFKKIFPAPKTKIFSYSNIFRRIYDMYEKSVVLVADLEYLYEMFEDQEGNLIRVNKIPLQEIIYVICSEFRRDYFEIFLKNNSRFVFKVSNSERNVIVTNILDIISDRSKNSEDEILLLSYKPKIEFKINGFINEEVDMDYENKLYTNLQNYISDEKTREKIIEDICVNFCLRSKKFRNNSSINKKTLQAIYEILSQETNKLVELQKQEINVINNKNYSKRLSVINHYLIFIQGVIKIFHSEKLIGDLFDLIESNNSQIIFYNVFVIYKNLLPSSSKVLKKEEIAQRKWMISSHFDNSLKIKNILYNKIFDFKTKQKIINFEENNVR